MKNHSCDFSPIKQLVKEELIQILNDVQQSIDSIDDENHCLLGNFARIKQHFFSIESNAASFYLMCYLSPYTDSYLDLSVSVKNLSEKRYGALIVIERDDPVDALIQRGTQIGAAFTSPLLESIFIPGSPLHDGAVVIKRNQIVSAANVLPLSNAHAGPQKLGTRHRAAIGLSERSDALVLVISEETGKASFALHGKLYPINAARQPLSYIAPDPGIRADSVLFTDADFAEEHRHT